MIGFLDGEQEELITKSGEVLALKSILIHSQHQIDRSYDLNSSYDTFTTTAHIHELGSSDGVTLSFFTKEGGEEKELYSVDISNDDSDIEIEVDVTNVDPFYIRAEGEGKQMLLLEEPFVQWEEYS